MIYIIKETQTVIIIVRKTQTVEKTKLEQVKGRQDRHRFHLIKKKENKSSLKRYIASAITVFYYSFEFTEIVALLPIYLFYLSSFDS